MYAYVPTNLPAGAPLVVALHGCTQSASDFYSNAGWPKYADLWGFAARVPADDLGEQLAELLQLVRSDEGRAGRRRGAVDQTDGRLRGRALRLGHASRLHHRAVRRRRDDGGHARRLSGRVRRRRHRFRAAGVLRDQHVAGEHLPVQQPEQDPGAVGRRWRAAATPATPGRGRGSRSGRAAPTPRSLRSTAPNCATSGRTCGASARPPRRRRR